MNRINVEGQKVICLQYFEGLNYNAIAIIMNHSPRTVARIVIDCRIVIARALFGIEDELLEKYERGSKLI